MTAHANHHPVPFGLAPRRPKFLAPKREHSPLPEGIRALLGRQQSENVRIERAGEREKQRAKQLANVKRKMICASGVVSSATLWGYIQGRRGTIKVGVVPLELIGAAAAHIGAFSGIGGREVGAFFHGVGYGSLASLHHTIGRGLGRERRSKLGLSSLVQGSMGAMPMPDETGGSALPDP